MTFASFIIHYIDFIWLPITWWVAHKRQRPYALFFTLICILSLRLQTDLVYSTGQNNGFTPLWGSDVRSRGVLVYGIFNALYLIMLYFSPRRHWSVLLSTTILVYITGLIIAMIFMSI